MPEPALPARPNFRGVLQSRSLIRQAGIYTVSNLVGRAIPFLLLPVLTRYLTPADYGIVSMFLLTALVVEPVVGLSLPGALTVQFYDRHVDLRSYLWTGLVTVAGAAIPVGLLVFVSGGFLSGITQVPAGWLLLVVPLVAARTVGNSLLALLRVRERALPYGLFQNVQSLTVISCALAFVVVLGFGWTGRVGAEIVATIASMTIAIFVLGRAGWLRVHLVPEYVAHLLRFGLPLIPHTLGSILIVQTDRLLLTNLVGVSETGLYVVGYQLAVVIEILAASFNNAYTPWLFAKLAAGDGRTKRRLVRYTYVQFGVMALFAGGIALTMPSLAHIILGRAFGGSSAFVPWFCVAFFFSAMYYMVTNYIFYSQRTEWLAAVTLVVAIANVPLTYTLIRLNGAVGAAQATSISLGMSFVLTWLVSSRVFPMPWVQAMRPEPE